MSTRLVTSSTIWTATIGLTVGNILVLAFRDQDISPGIERSFFQFVGFVVLWFMAPKHPAQ